MITWVEAVDLRLSNILDFVKMTITTHTYIWAATCSWVRKNCWRF